MFLCLLARREVARVRAEAEVVVGTEVEHCAKPLKPPFKLKHWWNKMFLYSKLLPAGINIYMDLDIVIIKNFDAEIEFAVKKLKEGKFEIACISDCIRWKNNKFSSSFMIFQTGKLNHIF